VSAEARPIRVVMFGGGPVLDPDVRRFLCRIDAHPGIELAGAFCQSAAQGTGAVLADLWRRRGILALPVLLVGLTGATLRLLRHPGRALELRRGMRRLAPRLRFVPDIHAPEVLREVAALEPELGLVYGSPILKPELYEIPRRGSLGIHHGKMPHYRGKKTTFWAMANGEATAGVTIQKIGRGLDTGCIVQQGEVPARGRSYGRVWRDVEQLGLDLYVRAILEFRDGTERLRAAEGVKGRLYRDPGPRDIAAFYWRRLTGRVP